MANAEVGNIHIGLYVDIGDSRRFTDVANLVERDSKRMNTSLGNTSTAVRALRTQMNQNLRIKLATDSLKDLSRATDEVGRLRAAMLGIAAVAGTGITGAFTGAYLVQTADKYRLLGNQISTVTDSSTNLASVQDALFGVSQRTRTSLEATTQIYARTARATQQYGVSQQNLLRITETVQKAFAVGGATPQEAAGAALQLSQGIASNRFGGDEYRSVAENAPVLLKGIADSLNVDLGQLRKMSQAGQLTAQTVTEAILKASDKIDAAFAKTIPTVAQSFTLLDNAFLRYVGQTDNAYGGTRALSSAIKGLADNFDEVMGWITKVSAGLAALYAARKLVTGTQGFVSGIQATNAGIQKEISGYNDSNKAIQRRLGQIDQQKAGAQQTANDAVDSIAVKQSNAINAAKEKEYVAQQKLKDLETQRVALANQLDRASTEELGRLQQQVEVQRQAVRDSQLLVIQAQEAAAAEERNLRAKQAQRVTKATDVVTSASGKVDTANSRVAETQAVIAAEKELAKTRLSDEIDSRRESLVTSTQRLRSIQAEIAELRSVQDLPGFDDSFGKQYKSLLGQQQKAIQSTQSLYKELDGLETKLAGIDTGAAATRGITDAMNKHAAAVQAAEKAVAALAVAEANRDKIASSDVGSQTLDRRLAAEAKSIANYEAAIAELQTRLQALSTATGEAFTGKSASKLADQISALDDKIVAAQSNLKAAGAAITEAQGGNVQMLNEALAAQSKAAEQVNNLQKEASALLERQVLNTNKLGAAQKRLSVIGRAGSSVLDFFGGPTGLAITGVLTAATLAATYYSAQAAESAKRTTDLKKEMNDLGYLSDQAAGKVDETTKSLLAMTSDAIRQKLRDLNAEIAKQKNSRSLVESLFGGNDDQTLGDIENQLDSIMNRAGRVRHQSDVDQAGQIKTLIEAAKSGTMPLDQIQTKLDAIAKLPLSAEMDKLLAATRNAIPYFASLTQGVTHFSQALNAAGNVQPPTFRQAENASMDSLRASDAAAQPTIDEELRKAGLSSYETSIKQIMDGIAKTLEKAGKLVDLGPIRAAAEKIYTDQQGKRGLLDLIGTSEGTDRGRGYNETLGYGRFTDGPVNLTQMTISEVLDLQSKILDQTRALPSTDPLYNSSAVGRYQITRSTLLDMMKQLGISGDTTFSQETQDRIAQQIIRGTGGNLAALRGRWPSLNNVSDSTIKNGSNQTFATLPRLDESQQKWVDGLKDLDLQSKVKGLTEFDQQVLQTGQSMGTTKEEMLQYIDAVTSGDLDKVPAKFKAISDTLKAGIDNGFGRQLKDLRDTGAQKGLSDLQQQVIETARSFGATEPEIKAYVNAISDGRLDQIPSKFKQIQDALQVGIDSNFTRQLHELSNSEAVKFLSDLQQKVIDTARQFGLSEPEIKAYVDAISDGRLDQVPAKFQLITQQLQKSAANDRLIEFTDGLADSIGNLFTDMANGDDAFGNLLKNLEKLVVQILVVEPIVNSLKSTFRNLTGSLGGGGGILGSLLGGGTGTGANYFPPAPSSGIFGGILGLADGGPTDVEEQKPGPVRGPGGPRDDKKLVYLSNGEYVFDSEATKNAGVEHLRALQQYLKRGKLSDLLKPKAPKMADGGAVANLSNTVPASQYLPTNRNMLAANGNRMATGLSHSSPNRQIDNLHISFETQVAEDGKLQTYVSGVARRESSSSVKSGIAQYDKSLPDRMDQIKRAPKKR